MSDPADSLPVSVLLLDNYDSFTWNLVHLLGRNCARVSVKRNDDLSVSDIEHLNPDLIVLSPGPCSPNEAGICLETVRMLGGKIPIFGVCLGLQTIGQAYGGEIVRAPLPMHGKVSTITHQARGVFHGINEPFSAARYHSLVIDRETYPADQLKIIAETNHPDVTQPPLIMAASHLHHPVSGVQFHPESIASEYGDKMICNVLGQARAWNAVRRNDL
jgi:anthranilate synthase component II